MSAPVLTQWTDEEVFRPAKRHLATCVREFAIGEWYTIEVVEERSAKSHNHYFAALTETWRNLPEDIAVEFPSVEHLRKWALIRAGYSNDRRIPAPSARVANEIAAIAKGADEFALVELKPSNVVLVRQAKSQSRAAMGKEAFQASKDAVLEYAASLVGVTRDELEREAEERAA